MWLSLAFAAELPEVGAWDRYRVEVPDWPGAEATSTTGSVLLEPPPAGVRWTVEEAPVPDAFEAVEALDALAVAPWHADGADGAGVKVAVFDVQWFNADLYADELGAYTTHDCQAHRSCDVPMDTLRPRYAFEEGGHGIACAQVIHDIAPAAELHLVRVNGTTTMENAVDWAIREQIDVVSMSMSFFNNSFYDGQGPISALAARLAAGGVLLVNSAGNYATEHWDGAFTDPDGDGDLDFPWGSSYLPVYLGAGAGSVLLSWDQFTTCGDTDLDAWVYDGDGRVVGRGETLQDPTADSCSPVERVRVTADTADWYYLRVLRRSGDPLTRISVYARGGTAYQATPGSLADPAASPSAFTVGAVAAVDYLQNDAESFSSLGPSHAGAAKPDVAGPDGLTTAIYGSRGFYGTSASTPAVAGALAVLLSHEPGLDAFTAAERLRDNALQGGETWRPPDAALGAGKVRLWDPSAPSPCGGGAAWVVGPALLWWPRRRSAR